MTIRELHAKAMEIAGVAYMQKSKGELVTAKQQFALAFDYEKQAALLAYSEKIGEPSISIFLKSAAYLAKNCDNFIEAEKLLCLALSGNPLPQIADEMRDLLEQVTFERHLQLKGIELNDGEYQVVFSGNGIGLGMIKAGDILFRLEALEKINNNTVLRKTNRPYKNTKSLPSELDKYNLYYSVPRAASFAMTVKIGKPENSLFPLEKNEIIDDIIENIGLVNIGNYEQLRINIPDEAFYTSFISSSKLLAPDGETIAQVGFTVLREGKELHTSFVRKSKEINFYTNTNENKLNSNKTQEEPEIIELVGILDAAKKSSSILTLKAKNANYKIIAREGLEDIVKHFFGQEVKISATENIFKPKYFNLINIDVCN